MDFSYSIDRIEVFENELDHRLYLIGWCLGNEGEIPKVSLYINNTLVHCTMETMSRFDAYRAMEEIRRNNKEKP